MLFTRPTLLATFILSHITSAAYAIEDQSNILPTISIKAQQDKNNDYVATQATSTFEIKCAII